MFGMVCSVSGTGTAQLHDIESLSFTNQKSKSNLDLDSYYDEDSFNGDQGLGAWVFMRKVGDDRIATIVE